MSLYIVGQCLVIMNILTVKIGVIQIRRKKRNDNFLEDISIYGSTALCWALAAFSVT
jgi:hypothetical protein